MTWDFWLNPVDNALEKEYQKIVDETCPLCKGTKRIRRPDIRSMHMKCPLCEGIGKRARAKLGVNYDKIISS